MRSMPDRSIDAVITSPPYDNLRDYGGSYSFDFEPTASQLYRILKDGGVVVWVVGDSSQNGSETGTSFRQALYFMDLGFNLHDTMIYERDTMPFPEVNRYEQAFQFMFVFTKGSPKTFNPILEKTRGHVKSKYGTYRQVDGSTERSKYEVGKETRKRFNIWRYGVGYMKSTTDKEAFEHPAIFPELLASDHINSWTDKDDTVLDCFMGSGTTGKMCMKLYRNFIGCEINPDYYAIAEKRISEAASQMVMF